MDSQEMSGDQESLTLQQRVSELEQQVELYQKVFEQLATGLFIYRLEDINDDHTLRLMMANPAVGELTGFDPILEKTLDENYPGLREQGIPQLYANVVRSGEAVAFDTTYGDERVITSAFCVHAFPLPNQHIGISFDNITQQKQVEQQLSLLNKELERRVEERTAQLHMFQTLVEKTPDGIAVATADGIITYVNPSYQRMFEYGDELIGMHIAQLHQVQAERLQESFQNVMEHGSWQGEILCQRKDRSVFPGQLQAFVIRDEQGNIQATAANIRDITERKKSEKRLYELQQTTRLVIDNMPQAIFWKDINLHYLGCNRLFAQDAGLASPDDVVGKTDYDMPWAADLANTYREDDRRVIETNTPTYHYQEELVKADGSKIWIQTSKVPMHDSNDEVFAVLGIYEDITERKRIENALRDSEERSRMLFQNMSEGMVTHAVIYDDEGKPINYRILEVNPAFERMLQISASAIKGKLATEAYGTESAPFLDIYARVADTCVSEQFQTSFGSQVFDIRVTSPRRGEFVTLFFDITNQKHQEEERSALQQQVIEAQRAALRELSSPLIPITDHVVIMPLIGTIDSTRAQQIMETLLEGVAIHRADIAIIDITGVAVVDTQVANALIQAAQAVRLLGSQVMLTGIGPAMAQTLVHLGADLSGIITRGTLQHGIASVLKMRKE